MVIKEKGDFRFRLLHYVSFLHTWIPVVRYSEEKGKYYSTTIPFYFELDDNYSANKSLFGFLSKTDKSLRREILGDVDEAKRSPFNLRRGFRAIGFNLSHQEDADPNRLVFFDFGVKLEKKIFDLNYGVTPGTETIDMGPTWAYDIFIQRLSLEKNEQDQWNARPANKVSPLDNQLTKSMMNNPEVYNQWYASKNLSEFFTPEQLAAIDNGNLDFEKMILDSLDFMTDEKILERLAESPINFNAPDPFNKSKPLFIPGTIEQLTDKFVSAVKQRHLPAGTYYLLEAPAEEGDAVANEELEVTTETPKKNTVENSGATPAPVSETPKQETTKPVAPVKEPNAPEADMEW